MKTLLHRYSAIVAAALVFVPASFAQTSASLTWEQKEAFLKKAKVTDTEEVSQGVTGTQRVTMTDGTLTHDASRQRINESKVSIKLGGRTVLNYKDSWQNDVAAWKVARMIGIGDMTPVSVERSSSAFRWWVEDVIMDETKRLADRIQPPDMDRWRMERDVIDTFDHLIYNWDRNQGNFVYDKDWNTWMVDHTRSFRLEKTLLPDKRLSRVDRKMLEAMKALTKDGLKEELGRLVSGGAIDSLLARRDLIVQFVEERGDVVLFDRPARR